jgi:hypothetical protein
MDGMEQESTVDDGVEMVTDGGLTFCVTTLLAVPMHPFAFVTVTV